MNENYPNSDNHLLDSKLNEIPRWALVALSVRCAKRLQPLFNRASEYVNSSEFRRYKTAIDEMIEWTEQSFLNGATIDSLSSFYFDLYNTSVEAYNSLINSDDWSVVRTVAIAQESFRSAQDDAKFSEIVSATSNAIIWSVKQDPQITISVLEDIILLTTEALKENWDNNTPIPITLFNTLWPNDAPEWYREALRNLDLQWKLSEGKDSVESKAAQKDLSGSFMYDVALSFASEDRKYVEKVADILRNHGVKVFYDLFEESTLWGKNLYTYLQSIYRDKAKFTIIFCSSFYAKKIWTNHELQSAQERALRENYEYILPARFDDTEIPGLKTTIGYIDLQKTDYVRFSEIIIEKIQELSNKSAN